MKSETLKELEKKFPRYFKLINAVIRREFIPLIKTRIPLKKEDELTLKIYCLNELVVELSSNKLLEQEVTKFEKDKIIIGEDLESQLYKKALYIDSLNEIFFMGTY